VFYASLGWFFRQSGVITFMEPTLESQAETLESPRIVRTPGTCGGKPRIDGHRIKVEHIAICHERMGMSPDEIVTSHPTITLAQVHAALAYYYEHKAEIDADIEEGKRYVDEIKANSPPSKLQQLLKARKANGSDDSLPPGTVATQLSPVAFAAATST
jgi:uncharacterized protein (DUF433 family)